MLYNFKKSFTVSQIENINLDNVETMFWTMYADTETYSNGSQKLDMLDILNLLKFNFEDAKEEEKYLYLLHLNLTIYELMDELIENKLVITLDDVRARLSLLMSFGSN